jgi:tetraacyldisaccharide 4'-kinase
MTRAQQSALQGLLTRAWTRRGLVACLLWPVALLFGVLVGLRRTMYRVGMFKVARLPVPVIVVGNVIAGGSGKTPVVMALVQQLRARGLQVGVISRGYGRRSKDCLEVLAASSISDVGDEPALIRRATQAPVFVAQRRLDAALSLLARYPETQVIVCDDGLQHLGLHRDLEICVFDDRGIGNGWLLPAGPLREHWPRAVDLVLHTGARPAFAGFAAKRTLARHAVQADGSPIALDRLAEQNAKTLLAVAAIAKPDDFFAMLCAQGLKLDRTVALPDHHDFADWQQQDYAQYTVLCTEKDAVKLWHRKIDVLAIPLVLRPEAAFMEQFDAMLSALLKPAAKPTLSSGHGHTTS